MSERCEVCGRKATWIITVASGVKRGDTGRPLPVCDKDGEFYLRQRAEIYPRRAAH